MPKNGGDGDSTSGGGSQHRDEVPPSLSTSSQQSGLDRTVVHAEHDSPTSGRVHRGSVSSPTTSELGIMSPGPTDRVFPIRSVVQVDPTIAPAAREHNHDSYFGNIGRAMDRRRASTSTEGSIRGSDGSRVGGGPRLNRPLRSEEVASASAQNSRSNPPRLPPQVFSEIIGNRGDEGEASSSHMPSQGAPSNKSAVSGDQDLGGLVTTRFKHVVTEDGHAIITGRDGDAPQRCEDEPIHIPGAVQGFGLLIALMEVEGKLQVRIVSENSKRIIGYTPKQLFELESFTDILSEEQADNLLDHIDFIREEETDVATNGPEVFTMSIRSPKRKSTKLWCAMHVNDSNPGLIICEFELEDDFQNPLAPSDDLTPDDPEDTLHANPTAEEYAESTQNISRPLRVLRSARKRRGEAAAMEVFNIMSQVQEQLAAAPTLDRFLKVLVGVVKELTGFHRVMIYQFDHQWNGKVVTELVDPRATKDLYLGLHFPASDIPKQARDLYKINKVRMLYDRDQETARLVCKTMQDLENPLDLTYSYLRAMSPIHLKYLANMAVRSSMSISINAFNELWGLISCHSYGPRGMRVAFPIRKMCRLVGDIASRNIERLSYASRLQARKLINTVPSEHNPSGYIIASSEDLLKLFNADCGLLSIQGETKILGRLEQSQEALAMLEYLRMRKFTAVTTSQDIVHDFPDLKYAPGFSFLAGLLFVPLSAGGHDFIVFFRKGQLREVKWAGNPYEKVIKEGTEGYLEPRKSFKLWSEMVVGRCKEWTEEEVETAAVLCLVYGKFIEVWRQKEAALQKSQLTRLLLANSAHEVRTPLNAIINYLEIALEGTLDQETRENLAKSHSASKSLIYVINDLLDLTKTEEGVELIKGESFDLKATLKEATESFHSDAKRKGISYEVVEHPGLPNNVIGDQRRVRQAITNITANAIQATSQGSVTVEMYVSGQMEQHIDVEVVVTDTGKGMSDQTVDAIFRDMEQVQSEMLDPASFEQEGDGKKVTPAGKEGRTLGLGLAVVARIIRNMNGQMRLKSEEGKGSRFALQFPFELPSGDEQVKLAPPGPSSLISLSETGKDEILLVKKDTPRSRTGSVSSGSLLQKRNSADSLHSMNSKKSVKSVGSAQSARSDVDRLIEAIQGPHMAEEKRPLHPARGSRGSHSRPSLEMRHSYAGDPTNSQFAKAQSVEQALASNEEIQDRPVVAPTPGEEQLPFSNAPVRAIKVPDDEETPISPQPRRPDSAGAVMTDIRHAINESGKDKSSEDSHRQERSSKILDAKEMVILVAEDDPINSKIVKKRMESRGHKVRLTTNGEECATAYCEGSGEYDAVLMDIQMPIVDGLTSTKMIRSYEKTTASHKLSPRAALNGRIPIIAVSASLEERERDTYVSAGFDAWILKPISFDRLQTLLECIVDAKTREECLYKPGHWEQGGWFENAHSAGDQTEPKTQSDKDVALGADSSRACAIRNEESEGQSESLQTGVGDTSPTKSTSAPAAVSIGSEESTHKVNVTEAELANEPGPQESLSKLDTS
ncbi:hypothetical protein, variant [Verruconis gallopava]|uniref:Cyanobacterial phytochrome B n=1 Tax=Verruconis gallopava TaxID=253628 RepID=A0A0D2AD99_9PEZI|nr:uncharacterized protein PV09_04692 [Verruconis gallopava]XP_016214289.1 hypothetical protein, variant [Verruconis gallopava]KIW04419.1 hypothetical protein PV09_04692 [Verruconis gallopava]KIW04420.1 hypothetical protein, variant [Verruconis gallopava]